MEFNKTIRLVSNWLLVTLNKNCHSKYVHVFISFVIILDKYLPKEAKMLGLLGNSVLSVDIFS